jgi:flagellar biogenesis protein FliO
MKFGPLFQPRKAKSMRQFKLVAMIAMVMGAGGASAQAHAVTSLKQVQISNGSQIDLLFDGKVQKGQIRTEFINDIIQLSISDVSVYPAKISSVNGGSLTKIFAYQYAPKLVRCRLTVKGKAESYKDKFDVRANGKILTIRVDDQGGITVAAQTAAKAAASNAPAELEERALLNRVLAADGKPSAPARDSITLGAAAPVAAQAPAQVQASATSSAASPSGSSENLPLHANSKAKLTGGKPLPSPLGAFGKMAAVLALFGACAFGFKRFAQNKSEARIGGAATEALAGAGGSSGILGAVGRFAKKNLSRNGRMIEVLSTHYLGPKKSIAVVRVAGRILVLGVSNDAINLITQLPDGEADALGAVGNLDLGNALGGSSGLGQGTGATVAGNAIFADLLNSERANADRGKSNYGAGNGPSLGQPAAAPRVSQTQAQSAYAQLQSQMQPTGLGAPRMTPASATVPGTSSDSLSSVRAQIRNRLEGLKPL